MDKLDRCIKEAGGPTAVAARMGISVQRLSNWVARGVPFEHCAALESALDRQIRRWDLRPDDWHCVWPELIGADGAPSVPQREAA